jgi:hypothetical protein
VFEWRRRSVTKCCEPASPVHHVTLGSPTVDDHPAERQSGCLQPRFLSSGSNRIGALRPAHRVVHRESSRSWVALSLTDTPAVEVSCSPGIASAPDNGRWFTRRP